MEELERKMQSAFDDDQYGDLAGRNWAKSCAKIAKQTAIDFSLFCMDYEDVEHDSVTIYAKHGKGQGFTIHQLFDIFIKQYKP